MKRAQDLSSKHAEIPAAQRVRPPSRRCAGVTHIERRRSSSGGDACGCRTSPLTATASRCGSSRDSGCDLQRSPNCTHDALSAPRRRRTRGASTRRSTPCSPRRRWRRTSGSTCRARGGASPRRRCGCGQASSAEARRRRPRPPASLSRCAAEVHPAPSRQRLPPLPCLAHSYPLARPAGCRTTSAASRGSPVRLPADHVHGWALAVGRGPVALCRTACSQLPRGRRALGTAHSTSASLVRAAVRLP